MKISVVVVTYNRQKKAEKTIKSLLTQSFRPFEIIAIDDASSPPYKPFNLSLIKLIRFDKEVGLSSARNHGIKAAKGDYVAFIDDDCIATKTWIEEIQKAAENGGDIIGGPLIPMFEAKPPAWWKTRDLGYFVGVGNARAQEIWGANMVFRREVFKKIGFFNTKIGRQKGRLLSGEDTNLIYGSKENLQILFVPNAVVYHTVGPDRLSMSYIIRWSYNFGKSHRLASGPGKLAFFLFLKAFFTFLNPFANIGKSGRILQIGIMFEQIGAVI